MRLVVYPDMPWAPIGPVVINAGSALPIDVVDAPAGALAVRVAITNADGQQFVLAAQKRGCVWRCVFPGSCFARSGRVSCGVQVIATIVGDEAITFVGDFEALAATPGVNPGTGPIGGDIYQRTRLVNGVQHYAKQVVAWDEDMAAWSADWVGDYIIVGGVFVEA